MRNPFAKISEAIDRKDDAVNAAMQEPEGPVARPADIQTSANDVQEWRKQDILIAEYAAAISEMQVKPWRLQSLATTFKYTGSSLESEMPPLVQRARMLSMLSNPLASIGRSARNTGSGDIHYVTVGNTRVGCISDGRSTKLGNDLNRLTFDALRKYREECIQDIERMTLGKKPLWELPSPPPPNSISTSQNVCAQEAYTRASTVVFASTQLCVFVPGPEEAEALASQLNKIYTEAISEDLENATRGMLKALHGGAA